MQNIQQSLDDMAFRILPLTERIGATAADLIEAHALSHGLRLEDALIAATAIDAGEILTTSNVRNFRAIRSLEVKVFSPSARRSR